MARAETPDLFVPLVYTPDDFLVLRTDLKLISDAREHLSKFDAVRQTADTLDGMDDVSTHLGQDKVLTTAIDAKHFLMTDTGDYKHIDERSSLLKAIINDLSVVPRLVRDENDPVVELTTSEPRGLVHHQFQRWLNSDGLTESVARRCLRAMSVPLVLREELDIGTNASIYNFEKGLMADGGLGIKLTTKPEHFRAKRTKPGFPDIEENAVLNWMNLDVSTLGDSTTLGSRTDHREKIFIRDGSTALYEMTASNIDYPNQSISLILALGVLAYEAFSYIGDEDIFDGADWQPNN